MDKTTSIKINQIVSLEGIISIDVFKNFKLPDDSKLLLNCHGDNKDSILLNCPNGGILFNSNEVNIESMNYININSLDNIRIISNNIIEIGNIESGILINNENSTIDLNFIDKNHSYIKLSTNNFSLINKNNSIIINDKSFNFKSNKNINFGNSYNSTLKINCNEDTVIIDGNMYINGSLYISNKTICKNISNITSNNNFIFDIKNNPNKNWCIKDDNDNGINYSHNKNVFEFKSKNDYINLECRSINLCNNIDNNNNNYINILDKFYINNNCDIYTQGSIKIDNNLNINDVIKLNNKGYIEVENDIIVNNYHISNLFKYTVGLHYKYSNIQDCIDYIVENEFYKNGPIYISIYPNKDYYENIIINYPNINLIGKYSTINLYGSLNIKCSINKNDILIKNLKIISSLNKCNNIHLKNSNIKFKNININLKDQSKIIIDARNITFDNCEIYGDDLKISNSNIIYNINSKFKINKDIICNKISYLRCYIEFNDTTIWKLDIKETTLIVHSEINTDLTIEKFKNKFFSSKNTIIIDSILKFINNKDGVYYPRLILNPNYNN